MNDLMDTKNEISEMLNKKREVDRKIEEENKKFREIEQELIKKISELNRDIANAQQRKQQLEMDKSDGTSLKEITDKSRGMDIKLGELKALVETLTSNVNKTEKSIETYESMLSSN